MKPFEPADIPPEYRTVGAYMNTFHVCYEEAKHMRDLMLQEKFFINDTYQVNTSTVKTPFGPVLHLSIKRLDNTPCHDWNDFQKIKNFFAGPECEGIELFPAESRLTDCAHQWHIWCLTDPSLRIPIGWQTRMVASELHGESVGSKQLLRY